MSISTFLSSSVVINNTNFTVFASETQLSFDEAVNQCQQLNNPEDSFLAKLRNREQYSEIVNISTDIADKFFSAPTTGNLRLFGIFIDLIIPEDVPLSFPTNPQDFVFSNQIDRDGVEFYHKLDGDNFPWGNNEPNNVFGVERCVNIIFFVCYANESTLRSRGLSNEEKGTFQFIDIRSFN